MHLGSRDLTEVYSLKPSNLKNFSSGVFLLLRQKFLSGQKEQEVLTFGL